MKKKTFVLGASSNPGRYSNMAIELLRSFGHPVVATGNKDGMVGDVSFSRERVHDEDIDTVTMYLSAKNQKEYEDYILGLHPKRIIFNPGAENEALAARAREKGIQTLDACTLVLLRTGQY